MIDYEQVILRSLFKDFSFNEETRRIEPRVQRYVNDELVRKGIEECGFTREQAINYIQKTIDGISDVLLTSADHDSMCRLSDLQSNSLIRIRHEGMTLTLLYLDGCNFCLLKDDTYVLQPGDHLQCWSYTLTVGDDVLFRVFRNGKCYPDDRHVVQISHIEAIERFRPIYLPGYAVSNHTFATGIGCVCAWQAVQSNSGYVFISQDLTSDLKALFIINLRQMEFSLNKDFDQSLYPNYFDVVIAVCNYTEEAEMEKRRHTILPGKLKPVPLNTNQYALLVCSKAVVTL